MKLVLIGDPIAKIRSRTFTRGNRVQSYDPQYKLKVNVKKEMLSQVINSLNLTDKQCIVLEIRFFMPFPKINKSEINLLMWYPDSPFRDLDNLVKFYLDCGNGILWHDDRQIIEIFTTKEYSNTPRTEISMEIKQKKVIQDQEKIILGTYGPAQVESLISILERLRKNLHSGSVYGGDNNQFIENTAIILSELSDLHSPLLNNIRKKCPGYWKNKTNGDKLHA